MQSLIPGPGALILPLCPNGTVLCYCTCTDGSSMPDTSSKTSFKIDQIGQFLIISYKKVCTYEILKLDLLFDEKQVLSPQDFLNRTKNPQCLLLQNVEINVKGIRAETAIYEGSNPTKIAKYVSENHS